MRAFAIAEYKGPLREVEVPDPVIGEHDVLIAVDAAGLNHLDEKIRTGEFKQMLPYALPLTLGHDLAGTVVAVGAKVTSFAAGNEVYARPGTTQIGTFAQRWWKV